MDGECMGVIENKDGGIQSSESVLNTVKVEGKCITANERSDEESVWSECPDHILESMFSTLLVEASSRFRIMCKEWNTLLSSNRFMSLIPERDPWILLCSETHAMAYCFLTQSWKTISLSFLPSPTAENLSHGHSKFCSKSGAGLLLIEITEPRKMYMICNPLTSTYREIPAIITEKVSIAAIMDYRGSYKIVGLPKDENSSCIEIYHCSERSWRIAVKMRLPDDFNVLNICCVKDLVVCASDNLGFVVYEMETKLAHLVPFPDTNLLILGDVINTWIYELVQCGSSILFVVNYLEFDPDIVNSHVIVWELFREEEGSIWKWKEITRMPAAMCRKFIKAGSPVGLEPVSECHSVGVGNFLCLTGGHSNTKVFVYSLQESCWSRIRLPQPVRFNRYNQVFSFQPKPSMKV